MWKEKFAYIGFYISYWIVRFLVRLRYRFEIVGLDKLNPDSFKRSGGIVFLPNHPAEIDPVILEAALWPRFRPRPLIVEHFYRLKGFKFFLDLAKVLPIPSMDAAANKWRAKKVEKQFCAIVEKIKNKENFLIYPSGRLKISGMEVIGGASFVHHLLEACPEANIVLVRTTGLWGSMFSRALTGSSPDFTKVVWKGIKILLKNGFFFTPKRLLKIELEVPSADFPYGAPRLTLNKYLEEWYNRYPEKGGEPVSLVSYAWWKKEFPTVFLPKEPAAAVPERFVSSAIQDVVFKELSLLSKQPVENIRRTMHLSHDLGLDSLDVAEIYIFLDEKYEVGDLVPGTLRTVEDVLQAAAGYKRESEEEEEASALSQRRWPEEKKRLSPEIPPGRTLQEVFLRSCERNKGAIACTDLLSGPLSYRKIKTATLVLAEKFRELIPGDKVGILLPSSCSAYIVVLAVLCARKIPVLLNWTSGVRALDHALDLTHLTHVISSDRFLDKLENGDFGKMEEKFLLLEDVRPKIRLLDKIKGWWRSRQSCDALLKELSLDAINPSDPALILFTSGTESLPKGVPLSHDNLLSNQRASMSSAQMQEKDILYGILPPFHSFGISVSGLLPLFGGFKVCFAPNPNDSHGMAKDIAGWKPTLLFCAPSFIRALFRVSKSESLQSLRLIVSGAEKTPQELFDYVKSHLPHAELIEGYGITECSPVVSFDRPGTLHKGVGLPISEVNVRIIDPDTGALLPAGKEGEVCISGPSVFSGYLGNKPDPFILLEGQRFYRSGDRGWLDADGTLILTGRMKRFVKIGGEMVSLAGLEEELLKIAQEKHWSQAEQEGPPLAISVKEKDTDKPVIVLYTTFSISKEDVNSVLKDSGYGRIVKIGDVRKVDHIPLTGTGKTHYRLLDEMTS
ncbi:MAG TPA: AMP-binding protein [Rhabdochlamydiaceae bacterium]|jgi:long-chain-fatty-acid--[acyl-carrier-protein] ligase